MKIESCLRHFQIQFSDGQKWESGENVYFCIPSPEHDHVESYLINLVFVASYSIIDDVLYFA